LEKMRANSAFLFAPPMLIPKPIKQESPSTSINFLLYLRAQYFPPSKSILCLDNNARSLLAYDPTIKSVSKFIEPKDSLHKNDKTIIDFTINSKEGRVSQTY